MASCSLVSIRAGIISNTPYLAEILYSFVYIPTESVPTAAVTKKNALLYNPKFLFELPPLEAQGVLVHECLHVMMTHLPRIEALGDAKTGNIAADLAINDLVYEMGYGLPPGACTAKKFGFSPNQTLEVYFDLLKKSKKHGKGDKGDKSSVCAGSCGSGVGHSDNQDTEDAEDQDVPEMSGADKEILARRAVLSAKEHFSSRPGSEPGWLKELLERLNKPSAVPWRSVLRSHIRAAVGNYQRGSSDYSLKRLSKRTFIRGVPIPGMVDYPPSIAIAVDTSGSMSQEQLAVAFSETLAILSALGIDKVWVLQADVLVADARRMRVSDLRKDIKIHGRGGTSFSDALRKADALKPRPSIIIYMTDGYGSTDYKPRGHVVWCIIGTNAPAPTPWGTRVHVKD